MAGSQIPTSVTIIDSLSGFQAISLTEFDTSAQTAIAAGSKLEVAGAFFQFAGDETPSASSWSVISTGATAYIQCAPSGTAGSQILTATYTDVEPTWRDDLQGWYASAGSTTRVVASVYKNSSTSYLNKYVLAKDQEYKFSALKASSLSIISASVSSALSANSCSVASTISTNAEYISSTLSVSGLSIIEGGIKATNTLVGSSITIGSALNVFSSFVSTIGDKIIINGGIILYPSFPTYSTTIYACSHITKTDSTTYTIYGLTTGLNTSVPLPGAIYTTTASCTCSISW